MHHEFRYPDFQIKCLELRYENGVVCIYGTPEGLKKLAILCEDLVEHPGQGHIHIEESGILTKESEKGVIAIFGISERGTK
jgi:hypothetical protein